MFKLGEMQELQIDRFTSVGVYLMEHEDVENASEESVLLPNKEVKETMEVGDTVKVFLYKDFMDRLTATTKYPKIKLGEVKSLKVVDVNEIGAFLDWGLVKDLLLPFDEQKFEVKVDQRVMVMLKIDDQNRLYATMRIYQNLSGTFDYSVGDTVVGKVYQYSRDLGTLVAVDGKYHGLILKHDLNKELEIGETVTARVTNVSEDGKLNVSLKKQIVEQMDEDASEILYALEFKGELPYNDKSDAEDIKEEFNMSKRAFKRAIGRLLKLGKIEITEDGIKLTD
ncbi:S1-like domain-containing RNA-binding protein [Clostridiaceae bacterium HSG29]|nr:S1-like domain-containing RNA-binding protein [Clostridiaceae bacterium HSG29]